MAERHDPNIEQHDGKAAIVYERYPNDTTLEQTFDFRQLASFCGHPLLGKGEATYFNGMFDRRVSRMHSIETNKIWSKPWITTLAITGYGLVHIHADTNKMTFANHKRTVNTMVTRLLTCAQLPQIRYIEASDDEVAEFYRDISLPCCATKDRTS